MRAPLRKSLPPFLALLFGITAPCLTHAEEPGGTEVRAIDPRIPVHAAGALLRGWPRDPARWFLAARADLGYLFFSPRAEFGYGFPHEHWAGVDVAPLVSRAQAGVYAGLRYRHPRYEFRTGGFVSYALKHAYLEPSDSFDHWDLELEGKNRANYAGSDSELTLSIPLGRVLIGSETQALFVFAGPDDKYLFVDPVGAVVAPPWVFRQRLLLSYPFPGVAGFFLSPAGEAVFVPERTDPWVIRAGAILSLSLYQDVDVVTEVLPTVRSPDTLGRAGAPWLEIALRVRWATGRSASPPRFKERTLGHRPQSTASHEKMPLQSQTLSFAHSQGLPALQHAPAQSDSSVPYSQ